MWKNTGKNGCTNNKIKNKIISKQIFMAASVHKLFLLFVTTTIKLGVINFHNYNKRVKLAGTLTLMLYTACGHAKYFLKQYKF